MRNIRWVILFICVVISLSIAPIVEAEQSDSFVLTAEEQAYLDGLRTRPITIAYSYDLINAEFNGESYGMIEPVLEVLRNEFGLTVNLVKANWHDAFIQVENGEVDFYGPIAISETRRQKYITVDPFYCSYSKVITRVDNPVNSMIGLYNRSIGLLEGSVISRTMRAYQGPSEQIIYFPTMDDMITGLKNGTIDAFATVDNAEYEILAHDDIQFEFSIDNFYVDQGFISGCEDMRMLASLLSRYLKANPQVADEIIKRRHQALQRYSQEHFSDEIAYLQENYSEIILYADASLYPLCYFEKGTVKGMLLEITEIFEELTDIKVSFYIDQETKEGTNAAIDKLKTGQFMAIVGAYYDIDTWNDPSIEYSPLLWMETFHTYSYEDSNELLGKMLGTLRFATDYLGWNNTTGNPPVLYDSHQDLLNGLKSGEVDAVYMGEMGFNYGHSVLKDYSLREVTGISAEAPMHMLYGEQNKEFNALFNQAMRLFQVLNPKSMGEWEAQSDKYKSEYIRMRYSQQIRVTVVIVIFMIILTALMYLFIRNLKVHKNTREQLVDVLDKVHYDEVTGIYNRRYLEDNLCGVLDSITQTGGTLSVMMLDVDFFKKYNDTYGHSMGDSCLKLVAITIQNSLVKEDDFVARYGGEEFIIILPNTDQDEACTIANKILKNVRGCNIAHKRSEVARHVTISIGVTTGDVTNAQSGGDYIKRADKALYMSKLNGRNRYTFLEYEETMLS